MDAKKMTTRAMLVLMLGLSIVVLMMGCSNQSPMSSEENAIIPPPPLTEENIAAGPAPGYSYVQINASQIINAMSVEHPMYTQQYFYAGVGGSLYFPGSFSISGPPQYMTWWHGLTIPPDAIDENLMVGMLVPDPDYAIVDYSPHPYQFVAEIQVELSYRCANLNEIGSSVEDLVIMYWNYLTGEYEEIPTILDIAQNKLLGTADHFSRYIIATRGD